ncbi:hypothetical protein C8R46DRAFT_347807 [Mycena filopes]|nr:hypothetical protein C8R46DRAFT_347807 [Mycena filopes]
MHYARVPPRALTATHSLVLSSIPLLLTIPPPITFPLSTDSCLLRRPDALSQRFSTRAIKSRDRASVRVSRLKRVVGSASRAGPGRYLFPLIHDKLSLTLNIFPLLYSRTYTGL